MIPTEVLTHDYTLVTGVGEVLPVNFKVLDPSHLRVYADGVLQTLSTDYSFTASDYGGSIESLTMAASTAVHITYEIPITQTSDFDNRGDYHPEVVEGSYDKNTLLVGMVKALVDRSVRLAPGTSATAAAYGEASKVSYIDSDGEHSWISPGELLAILNLEIPDSAVDQPTVTFADSATRGTTEPSFQGQIGIQLNTVASDPLGSIYVAGEQPWNGPSYTDDWLPITVDETDFNDSLQALIDRVERGQEKSATYDTPKSAALSLGDEIADYPTVGWSSDDFCAGEGSDDSGFEWQGFPRGVYIPQKDRIVLSYRVATGHGDSGSAVIDTKISDNGGLDWTVNTAVFDDSTTDYKAFDIIHLQDDRLMGISSEIETGGTSDRIKAYFSEDFGDTWDTGAIIGVGAAQPASLASTSSGLQLRDGTILVPYYTWDGTGSVYTGQICGCYRSTDGGDSWSGQIEIANNEGVTGYSEATFFQFPDSDDVVALIRSSTSASVGVVYRSVSTDGGLTWSAVAAVTPTSWTPSTTSTSWVTEGGTLYLVGRRNSSNTASGMWYSTDKGLTWTGPETDTTVVTTNSVAEGKIIPLSGVTALGVFGNESSTSVGNSSIQIRTYIAGAGMAGRQTPGLRTRNGGYLGYKGMFDPPIDEVDRDDITSPEEGETVFNTTAGCPQSYSTGPGWVSHAAALDGSSIQNLPDPSNLKVWLRGDSEDQGSVDPWPNAGTQGDFVGQDTGSDPVVTHGLHNGRRVMDFSSASGRHYIDTAGTASDYTFLNDGSAFTVLVTFNPARADPDTLECILGTSGASSLNRGLFIGFDDRSGSGLDDWLYVSISDGIGGGALKFPYFFGIASEKTGTPVLHSDGWNVLSFRCDGAGTCTWTLRVNGYELDSQVENVATSVDPRPSPSTSDPNDTLRIGGDPAGVQSNFAGYIGVVGVWDSELSDNEIIRLEQEAMR